LNLHPIVLVAIRRAIDQNVVIRDVCHWSNKVLNGERMRKSGCNHWGAQAAAQGLTNY
jgi:hypothetical protein